MLKVLVAPLDWGLGHATRCIPIISELLAQGCMVTVAARGPQKVILQEEFPAISFIEIPGYRVKYGKNRAFTSIQLIGFIPKILIRINAENRWFRRFCRQNRPDLVISDNRYGLYRPPVKAVLVTHQLAIRTGMGRWVDALARRFIYRLLERFDACWVPDVPGPDNGLAGELAHPKRPPNLPVRYIGPLSRLVRPQSGAGETPIDLLILLSGPEPQRTILERLLIPQVKALSLAKVVLVRGLPGQQDRSADELPPELEIHDHVGTTDMGRLIAASRLVVSRAGYSTVMDLAKLGKPAVMIPTPGQPEQEYLGQYLANKGWAICMDQRNFSLKAAILQAQPNWGTYNDEAWNGSLLSAEIARLIREQAQPGVADLG